MPVYEVTMATGEWSLKLREEAPITVRDAISVPFGHVVITGVPMSLDEFSGSQILEAAIYAGVCLRPGPTLEISGKGLAWHLDGGVLETAVTNSAADLETWVSDILTADDTIYPQPFTYNGTSAAGTLSTSFQYITRRAALDTVIRYYWGLEWRIRPTMEFVVDSRTAIYGSTPTALIARKATGYESSSGLWGIDGQAATAVDFESYATRVLAVGQDQIGGAAITTPYYGPLGDPLGVGKLIDAPLAAEASAVTTAGNILTPLTSAAYTYELSADRYTISQRAVVGSQVYVYDPLNGFVDATNPVEFAGTTYYPRSVRLVAMRWPIQPGMGVYYRHFAIGSGVETWTDLTPYVEWETGSAQLEIGTRLRDRDGNDPSLASLARPTVTSGAWTEYAPVLTNFTVGDGFAKGWYRRDGSTLYVNLHIETNTGASESGQWLADLPPGLVPPPPFGGSRLQALHGIAYNADGDYWRIIAEVSNGASYLSFIGADGDAATQFLGAGHPLTVASGAGFYVSGVIEVAIATDEPVAPALDAMSNRFWYPSTTITTFAPTVSAGSLPITWSATGLPSGITIDPASGAISGTTTSTAVQEGTATITATNSAGSDSTTFDWGIALFGGVFSAAGTADLFAGASAGDTDVQVQTATRTNPFSALTLSYNLAAYAVQYVSAGAGGAVTVSTKVRTDPGTGTYTTTQDYTSPNSPLTASASSVATSQPFLGNLVIGGSLAPGATLTLNTETTVRLESSGVPSALVQGQSYASWTMIVNAA